MVTKLPPFLSGSGGGTVTLVQPGPSSPTYVPFTEVDEAVRLLDTPSEPWSIELEVALEGRLDEGRLREAVSRALAGHAMARVRMLPARRSDRRYCWQVTDGPDLDPLQVVDCPDDRALAETRAQLQSLGVPLAESPPFRLRLARHRGADAVMLNVNHAAFDGFGSLRLLRSIARAYCGEEDPPPPLPLDEARQVRALLGSDDARSRAERFRALGEKVRDVVRSPARVAADGGRDSAGYGLEHRSLSPERTEALSALDQPGTVNDLLLAALNLTIAGWNHDHEVPCRRIGVLMPVNLRPKAWRQDVVTNMVLMVRVSTKADDRQDPHALVEAIAGQTGRVKDWGTGASLIEVLGAGPSLPVWVKQSLSPLLWVTGNRMVDTAVLSNLGQLDEPLSFGPDGGAPTGLFFSAPGRMPCGLSIGVATMAGRLHLSFRYRHPMFSEDAAIRFADRYLQGLDQLVARLG